MVPIIISIVALIVALLGVSLQIFPIEQLPLDLRIHISYGLFIFSGILLLSIPFLLLFKKKESKVTVNAGYEVYPELKTLQKNLGIQVFNDNDFEIVVEDVGFESWCSKDTYSFTNLRYVFRGRETNLNSSLIIQPHSSQRLYVHNGAIDFEHTKKIRCVFVKTEDGKIYYGKSKEFNYCIERLKSIYRQEVLET